MTVTPVIISYWWDHSTDVQMLSDIKTHQTAIKSQLVTWREMDPDCGAIRTENLPCEWSKPSEIAC